MSEDWFKPLPPSESAWHGGIVGMKEYLRKNGRIYYRFYPLTKGAATQLLNNYRVSSSFRTYGDDLYFAYHYTDADENGQIFDLLSRAAPGSILGEADQEEVYDSDSGC